MSKPITRQLLAIMFTDIVGYSALMQKDEVAALKMRKQHKNIFEQTHHSFNGKIVQYYGDGTLSIFQSAIEAVKCAIETQTQLIEQNIPVRIGLHLGDIAFNETEVFGDGVNLAARIEHIGVAGAVLISAKLQDEIKNHGHINTISMGSFQLKNIEEPVEIFAINSLKLNTPNASELNGKPTPSDRTIAVLPFANFSADEYEYFSDGITEEIINALAKINALKVTSRTSSFHFKNKNIPIQEIGKKLNVSTILEGSIRLAGNTVRITAQLIDVKEDYHFWSETFDRKMDNIFAVQDEISLIIADKLREHIGHFNLQNHLIDAPDIPLEVYKKYLKGRYHLLQLTLKETLIGIEIFKEVIELAPNFTLPYLDINQGYAYLGTMGLIPTSEGFIKAQPYLEKALELDANLPQSQLNLAWIECWQNWNLEAAYKHVLFALKTKPSDQIYITISNLLTVEGKLNLAHEYIDKALQLDPISAMNLHYKGFLFYLEEKYTEANIYFEKSLEINPELPFPQRYIGASLILQNQAEDALKYYSKLNDNKNNLTVFGGKTIAYAALNDTINLTTCIAKLEALLQSDLAGAALNYLVYAKVIQKRFEEALTLIEFGYSNKFPMVLLFATEPMLKPLWSNKKFQKLVETVVKKDVNYLKSNAKYKNSLINKNELNKYKQLLLDKIKAEKPYLDASLTLRSLADLINLPPNHLSELLNDGFQKNFSEFINEYRVEAFKENALNPKFEHLTLLAIAYDCGFNSKTAFNTFFKKSTGLTPKQFVKSQQEKF